MMRYKIIGFSILFLSSVAFAADEETKENVKTWDNYKIITERNIFSRYRTRFIPQSEIQQQVVVVPEQTYYTLRGITKQSDGYISFIEDSRTMGVTRFRKGDSIAEGKITGITLDYLSYENGGKTQKIEIGMNLEGQVVSSGMQYVSSGFGNSQGNSGFPAAGQTQGMGQFPGMGQSQTGSQTQGTGQLLQMGQPPGMGQMPDMSQFPGMGQLSGMDQSQGGRGQMQGTGQTQSTGQTAATGQAQSNGQQQVMGQSQSAGQASSTGQTGATTTQTVTETQQQGANSDDIMQRLKERRKKELEE